MSTHDWENHLKQQMEAPGREFGFDMDDEPEKGQLAKFGILNDAIHTLNSDLRAAFVKADEQAKKNQKTHRRLATLALLTGALAILLAILHPTLAATNPANPRWTDKVEWLEYAAVVAGAIAVALGWVAKFDKQWFIQRHRAERLRMLKFLALGRPELWCGKRAAWEKWLREQMDAIANINKIEEVREWAEGGEAEAVEPLPPQCKLEPALLCAYSDYYRWKRVEFEAAYFHRQAKTFRKQSWLLIKLPIPLFVGSLGMVLVHVIAKLIGDEHGPHENIWREIDVWALALGVLLPVFGLCVRAWLGAFEQVRSASLFEAKGRALLALSKQVKHDQADLGVTMRHVAHIEHFLEHEHREWLRLLLEAEWFL